MGNIAAIYQQRRNKFLKQKNNTRKAGNRISYLRLLSFMGAAFFFVYGILEAQHLYTWISLPLFAFFGVLISIHQKFKDREELFAHLTWINKAGLQRLKGEWTTFPDKGEEFLDSQHPYSSDLNIFGQGSLYQYINSTFSFTGRETLAKLLKGQAPYEEIKPRQQAVDDLARRLDFRQEFQATGTKSSLKDYDPSDLHSWIEPEFSSRLIAVMHFLWALPALTLLLFTLGGLGLIPVYYFAISLTAQILIAAWGEIHTRAVFSRAEKVIKPVKGCASLLRQIENVRFETPFLHDLQQKLLGHTGNNRSITASSRARVLSGIADRIYFRYANPLIYYPVNLALLWDWHTLNKLEKWKKEAGKDIETWFRVIGELEALCSLALPAHDHPSWTFPRVEKGPAYLEATSLGHPLIHREERVDNEVVLSRPGTILVITGSNMSGKSTLLRTTGINLVLAYSGAPVCAANLSCAHMSIYSKMQIFDNLEEKVSTFYAELMRIKMIVDAAQTRQPMIFLLDEIFRGTNSRDRIFATRNVIKKMLKLPTIGLITTHDLELSTLEEEHPGHVYNYHFNDLVEQNRISFDFKMRRGTSQTANAVSLMKMVGLDVEEEGKKEKE